jgi:hypothetical protein
MEQAISRLVKFVEYIKHPFCSSAVMEKQLTMLVGDGALLVCIISRDRKFIIERV